MSVVEEIIRVFEARGGTSYDGEAVSQTEHALQAAHLAEQDRASEPLVVAALVHDIGHLLVDLPENISELGIDDRHEDVAQAWLARHFGPEVTEPVRLHVAAKRYLCAVDPSYHQTLSIPSQRSLALQGGPMSEEEVRRFEANPHHRDAVRLRRWDDAAKVPGRSVPGLDHYRDRLAATARGASHG